MEIIINRQFDFAIISTGTYKTKGYYSKGYKSKAGLMKGLKAHGYPGGEVFNNEQWGFSNKQYTISFN